MTYRSKEKIYIYILMMKKTIAYVSKVKKKNILLKENNIEMHL